MEKMLEYVADALEASDYSEFKKLTRDSELNEAVFTAAEELDADIENSDVDESTQALEEQIDKLWSFIDNMNDRAAEKLDYNTELFRCMKIIASNIGGEK